MIQASPDPTLQSHADTATFPVCRNGREEHLTSAQFFAVAHRIWRKGDFETAKGIFQKLSSVPDCVPIARIFLASCHVMQRDYAACSATLHRALPKDVYGDSAVRLHDAFVLWKVGLYVDVKDSLKSLAQDHAELPSLNLLLAELLQSTGAHDLSAQFLRRAIRNDDPNGAVALVARAALKSMSGN